jgi:hypothetical protein
MFINIKMFFVLMTKCWLFINNFLETIVKISQIHKKFSILNNFIALYAIIFVLLNFSKKILTIFQKNIQFIIQSVSHIFVTQNKWYVKSSINAFNLYVYVNNSSNCQIIAQ